MLQDLLADLGWVDRFLCSYPGWQVATVPAYCPAVRWSISNLTQLNLSLLSYETPFKCSTSVSWILLYFHMRFVGGNLATHIAYFWLDGRRTFTFVSSLHSPSGTSSSLPHSFPLSLLFSHWCSSQLFDPFLLCVDLRCLILFLSVCVSPPSTSDFLHGAQVDLLGRLEKRWEHISLIDHTRTDLQVCWAKQWSLYVQV